MKKLSEIFNMNDETLIKDVKTNSKEVEKSDLFVCIKGFNVDRHDYVKQAEDNGASALVVEHKVNSNLPQIVVSDTNKELYNIVDKVYEKPSNKMTMIGITGTDGKTSTSTIISEFLNIEAKTLAPLFAITVETAEETKINKSLNSGDIVPEPGLWYFS